MVFGLALRRVGFLCSMPLLLHIHPSAHLSLAVWKIEEPEPFFTQPPARLIAHAHKRLQHLAARHLLHSLWPAIEWNQVYLLPGAKPVLPGGQPAFSVSHCGVFAAAIVQSSPGSAGIDVEVINERLHQLKGKFLHASEQRFVNSRPGHEQGLLLTVLWSAKESMFKWWGRGGVDFSEVLRTMPFECADAGSIEAAFLHPLWQQPLTIHYRILAQEQLVLTWVANDFVGLHPKLV